MDGNFLFVIELILLVFGCRNIFEMCFIVELYVCSVFFD